MTLPLVCLAVFGVIWVALLVIVFASKREGRWAP